MRILALVMAGGLLTACATTTDTGTVAAAGGAATPQIIDQSDAGRVNPNDLVCRYESPTGTRMRERICRTQAEWDAIQEAGRERIRHRQSTGNQRY